MPKSLLKGKYETGKINEIANMAFISGHTNRRISNKEAAEYLEEIVRTQGEEKFHSQRVPLERDLWKTDRYRDFLSERRRALAECINDFIRTKAGM